MRLSISFRETEFLKVIYKPIQSLYKLLRFKLFDLRIKRLANRSPLKIIVGSSSLLYQPGWISTDIDNLNLVVNESWERYFSPGSIDVILAEHVWEHLTKEESTVAAKNCFNYLKRNSYLRVAVPDGFHPDSEYIELVRPGGKGFGSDDHKVLYNYKSFSELFKSVGFTVQLIEWFDEDGIFHKKQWNEEDGLIRRSSQHDKRNSNGQLNYTSIILDAIKR